MSDLAIFLFGSPRVELDGTTVQFPRKKALGLLAYLAVSHQKHSRDTLAALFWPDYPQAEARANLRRTLASLHEVLGESGLEADRETLCLPPSLALRLDAAEFQQHLAAWHSHCRDRLPCPACITSLEQATALYSDDFMSGFNLPDSPAFDDWAFFQREELRASLSAALAALAQGLSARGDHDPAIGYARRRVSLDSLDEAAHGELMRVYAAAGQRPAALRQFAECERVLKEELGITPQEETEKLHEDILARRFPPLQKKEIVTDLTPSPSLEGRGQGIGLPAAARPRHNLPVQSIPFVGREGLLEEIYFQLSDPACRLLTLTGAGGSGKTRLAVETGQRLLDRYEHGVFFVSLAPLKKVDAMTSAVAGALGFSFYHGGQPRQQLLDYLRAKNMLLILDNFEHLMEGVDLPLEIIRDAPGVKVLVTSRSRLNVLEETALRVPGMDLPEPNSHAPKTLPLEEISRFSAVRFFVQCARRVQPGFKLSGENLEEVLHICHLVNGMPLAILLAAAWLEVLSLAKIAAEIERTYEFLETDLQDMPTRHRSMRAVFEQSWNLLGASERQVFAALSVFRGGFTEEAALQVAGSSIKDLLALLKKSFLQRDRHGRYAIHELLRQFAARRLGEGESAKEEVRDRHSMYYGGRMKAWEADLKCVRQVAALEEMDAESENCRAAWEWAAQRKQADLVRESMESLYWFYLWRRRIQEGEAVFRFAVEQVREDETPEGLLLTAALLSRQASFNAEMGQAEQSDQLFQQAEQLLRDERLAGYDNRHTRVDLL